MDTARDRNTLELIDAEELWNMRAVNANGYICRGCDQPVFPASFNKAKNGKRPHFRLGPREAHLSGCDVDGEASIIRRARLVPIGTREGFPLPFPSRLISTDERIVEPHGIDFVPASGRPRTRSGESEVKSNGPVWHHGHTVKTIRAICRTYMKFPNDRPFLPLTIPGVEGDTYLRVFKSLWGKHTTLQEKARLFYAPIRRREVPEVDDECCMLTLSAGEWDDVNDTYKTLFRVRVNWAAWSKSRRASLLTEFDAARLEAKEQAKTNKAVQGWLFFVGSPDCTDPSVFHVEHHHLICSLAGIVERPASK